MNKENIPKSKKLLTLMWTIGIILFVVIIKLIIKYQFAASVFFIALISGIIFFLTRNSKDFKKIASNSCGLISALSIFMFVAHIIKLNSNEETEVVKPSNSYSNSYSYSNSVESTPSDREKRYLKDLNACMSLGNSQQDCNIAVR